MSLASSIASTSPGSTSTTTNSTTFGIRGAELYTIIEAASVGFNVYVDSSNKAVQLLHQDYICSFKYVLLLVRDRSGNIIRGMLSTKEECS
jgi:hypothetical protein